MKPAFLIIGSAKSGTTSLRGLLGSHAQIFAIEKECHFFSFDENYARGVEWYESRFAAANGKSVRGEGSTSYTFGTKFPGTAERIARYNRDIKLIYMVREPFRRIESAWLQLRSWKANATHPSFKTALRANRELLVDPANYWREITRYREHFPDDQILVLFFEDFVADYQSVLRRCCEFLGVDPNLPVDDSRRHLRRSVDKRVATPFYSRLMGMPFYQVARHLVPAPVRLAIRQSILTTPVTSRPAWEPSARQWVEEQIAQDNERFLEFYGKPRGFWNNGV
jgi:phage baseplate assembly protein W